MIFIEKSPKPFFEIKYNESAIKLLIRNDFFDVCYLCERYENIDYEIDHFYPQKHFPEKENDWNNLYLICNKCNKIRTKDINSATNEVLDCCKKEESNLIELEIDKNSREVSIKSINTDKNLDTKVNNTIELLERIYNGKKSTSEFFIELRKEIIKNIAVLEDIIEEYKANQIIRKISEKKIIQHINIKKIKEKHDKIKTNNEIYKHGEEPCFVSFKRTLIKNDSSLKSVFEKYFD